MYPNPFRTPVLFYRERMNSRRQDLTPQKWAKKKASMKKRASQVEKKYVK